MSQYITSTTTTNTSTGHASASPAVASTSAPYPSQSQVAPDLRPLSQYTRQPTTIPSPQSDYALNLPTTRSPYSDYLRPPPTTQYTHLPNNPSGTPITASNMAQTTSPSTISSPSPNNGQPVVHNNDQASVKSNAPLPIDPSVATSTPAAYQPAYAHYPPGHDLSQYPGHHPHQPQMYARPEWAAHGYASHHGLPAPYAAPATTVSIYPILAAIFNNPIFVTIFTLLMLS